MKIEIKKYIKCIYKSALEGRIDDVIEYLKEIKKDHLENYKYIKINIDNDIDGDIDINLVGVRDETDEEYQARIIKTDTYKKQTEEREKATLATLKAKYENNK